MYDLVIVGGGLVGASLACAVSGCGLRCALLEAQVFDGLSHPAYDERSVALAYGSRRIFQGLKLWGRFPVTPIHTIHISERGSPGFTRLRRDDCGVEALGYVVTQRSLGSALQERLQSLGDIDVLCPAELIEASVHPDAVHLMAVCGGRERVLQSRLVVAADGARSSLRERLGIAVRYWDYAQSALIANVTPEFSHRNTAFERFTDSGPLALLPLDEARCAVVCTVDPDAAETLVNMTEEAFAAYLQTRFGERLGRFVKTGRRSVYPLCLVRSEASIRFRAAVIGNAAHNLHPVAGQGFNLSLRDVAALAEVVVAASERGRDPGTLAVLEDYARWRRYDQHGTVLFTDALARVFTYPGLPLRLMRGLGLSAVDMLPPFKRALARRMMGSSGRLPKLARGLPLVS